MEKDIKKLFAPQYSSTPLLHEIGLLVEMTATDI